MKRVTPSERVLLWVLGATISASGCAKSEVAGRAAGREATAPKKALTGTAPGSTFELRLYGQVVRGTRSMAQLKFELDGKALAVPSGPGYVLVASQTLQNDKLSKSFSKKIKLKDSATDQLVGELPFGPSTHAGTSDLVLERRDVDIDSTWGESRVSMVSYKLASGAGKTVFYHWLWPAKDGGVPVAAP